CGVGASSTVKTSGPPAARTTTLRMGAPVAASEQVPGPRGQLGEGRPLAGKAARAVVDEADQAVELLGQRRRLLRRARVVEGRGAGDPAARPDQLAVILAGPRDDEPDGAVLGLRPRRLVGQ